MARPTARDRLAIDLDSARGERVSAYIVTLIDINHALEYARAAEGTARQ